MTYPQQPGQYGGYQPQQPTGQYGYDQYGQYPQYGYPGGGYGPPPPPKRNTGAVVAVVAAILAVVAGLGITGFVAPGFFLSDDKNDNAGGGGTKTSQPNEGGGGSGGGADAFIDKLVAAADDKDRGTLGELSCADAEPNVEEAIRDIDEISGAELTDTEEVSDEEVKALVDITVDDETGTFETLVVKTDGDWCWQDITLESSPSDDPTGGATAEVPTAAPVEPSGDSSEGVDLVGDFLVAINEGDSSAATGMLCSHSVSQSFVTDAISNGAELAVEEGTLHADEGYVGANLVGELDGAPVTTARTTAFNEPEGWCVLTFYAY